MVFKWGLGIGDWGLGPIPNPQSPIPNPHPHFGDWGLGIGDWAQSPIPNPQSPIPNPQPTSHFINKIKFIFDKNKIIIYYFLNYESVLIKIYGLDYKT
jgi:hypothetical protein